MRWRLCFILFAATALFCFMLLTAVTDYSAGKGTQPQTLVSARGNAGMPAATLSAALPATAALSAPTPAAKPAAAVTGSLRESLKPIPPQFFVASNADPIRARRQAENAERLNRGKPANRKRLKFDENGWFREEVALVTAYCPCNKCCGSLSPGITSIGKNAWTPGLAADPEYLAYGTRVFVPGYGLSGIDDTGGAMRRHWRQNGLLHVDVRMTYHYEARQWGKQYLRIKIYDAN